MYVLLCVLIIEDNIKIHTMCIYFLPGNIYFKMYVCSLYFNRQRPSVK